MFKSHQLRHRRSTTATPPQKLSLHIGLNNVNNRYYRGYDIPTLAGCHNDARSMGQLAAQNGMRSLTFLDNQGIRNNLLGALQQAANMLKAGDFFFLTYSGHGDQVRNSNPSVDYEEDGKDETWCLYDGNFTDDELMSALQKFASGVRIFILSDSCHSGTMLDCGISMATKPKELKATCIFISGCQDAQYSMDGNKNGLFTETFLKVWNNGKFNGNYQQMQEEICRRMPTEQKPNFVFLGDEKDAYFKLQKPLQ